MVNIVDPHIKVDENYEVYNSVIKKELAVKDNNGDVFNGWCWPGNSVWVDYLHPSSNDWIKSRYQYQNYKGTNKHLHIWNDMNEPSVFESAEITLPKDSLHFGGWEHRDVHNLYGMLYVSSILLFI